MLYDKKGRVIRTNSLNYLGGHTRVDTNYDFIGKALSTKTYHKRSAADTEIEITENFTYTYADRLLKHTHKINSLPVQMLSYNQYDALGRLVLKKVGDVSESQFLQQVDYKYNVRGWLTDINNVNNLAESGQPQDLFAFKIGYNTLTQAHASVEPLYNGNIAQTFWRTASDNIKRSYGYVYDFQNRLRDAYYKIPNSSVNDSYNEHIIYDSNGNILQLSRYGLEEDDTMVYAIDDLLYEYDTGNKLINVMDLTNFSEGFNDGNQKGINGNTDDDFEYDSYGNLIKDRNKEIDEIVYNHLNLPKKIIFENENTIEYLYDASGTKLRKIVTDNTTSPTTVTTTHYLDGFQYSEDKLDFFPTIEGYVHVTYNSSTPGGPLQALYNYVYNYTDHLGNIRLRYTKNPGTGGGLRILEEDHYYPFGLKHQGYNNEHNIFEPGMPGGEPVVIVPVNPLIGDKYKYKFNGMEWQNELDLNFYDFGMRNYDPALGRWMNIDPLAEVSRRWSPYTYAYNNPIYFIDPDGMMAVSGSNLIKPNMLETASYERYVFWDGGGNSGGNDSGNNSTMEDYVDVDKTDAAPDVPESNLAAAGMTPGGGCPDGDCNKGKIWYKNQFDKILQHKFLKNFTFNDAIWHYRLGDGESVTVRLNTIDFGDLSVKDFDNPDFEHRGQPGKYVRLSSLSNIMAGNKEQALIYGTINVVYIGQNQIMVLPNQYDFDYQFNGSFIRNFATMLGSLYNGGGTPYYINFQGVTTIKD